MKRVGYETFVSGHDPETLASGSIFGALSLQATRFLLEQGVIYQVSCGENLFNCGDKGNAFYVVCEGRLDFYKHHQGRRYQTRSIGFGEEVGFVAMIALHEHGGDAVASEDSIVLEINTELFSRLHEIYPSDFGLLVLNLARDLARNIRKLSATVVEKSTDIEP